MVCRRLFPLLACLLACDASVKVSITSTPSQPDASIVVEPPVAAAEPPPPPPKLRGRRVLVVGDSEACAVAWYIDLKKVVADINDKAGQPRDTVEVDCKGGTVVQYWGKGGNLRLALARHPNPDAVLVFLGTNHYWQKVTPPTDTVTDLLKGTDCVWVGNTAVHGKAWPINGLIKAAVTPQCKYFDTEAANIPLADGVHPSPSGAERWVRLVWPEIPLKYEDTP